MTDRRNRYQLLDYLYCFLLLGSVIHVVLAADYVPTDKILLNCGANGELSDDDRRQWTSDVGSKFASGANSIASDAARQKPSVPTVPYMTAHIFRSEFTYSFPVSSGRKFVRLYFYPASYANLNASKGVFSVVAGPYTLLKNFSASETTTNLNFAFICKEYWVNVDSGTLNLTFTPAPGTHDSYAFVNGIEIMSHPDIYAVNAMIVGTSTGFDINNTVPENVYRVNVGGQAILNGVEIFKIIASDGNLAGSLPAPVPVQPIIRPNRRLLSLKSGKPSKTGINGGIAAVLLIGLFICLVTHKGKQRKDPGSSVGPSCWLPFFMCRNPHSSGSTAKTNTTGRYASSPHSNLCRHFSFSEIKAATKNFDETLVLGVGGFGKVYKGEIDGGMTKVAIKRGNPSSDQGVNEFRTEIEMLSQLRHRNLVSLIGYCEDNNEMILVYDYMAHGTLREHLYKSRNQPLPWKQRLEICVGSARGLHYLHTGAKHTIIHRDVKTVNILLDENWVAKVADFGLAKNVALDHSHVNTAVKGTFGFLDPEYFNTQQLTHKSDVYSYGVVLLEILCARPAVNPELPKEQVKLAAWAQHCYKKGSFDEIIDPYLKGKILPECFKKVAETVVKCVADQGIERPSMGEVLWNLEFALDLQERAEDSGGKGALDLEEGVYDELPLKGKAADDGYDGNVTDSSTGMSMSIGGRSLAGEDSDGLTPSAVFEQIMNPEGR